MGRLSALFIAFALGAACAVGIVSCGGEDDAGLLPGTTADQIKSNLIRVEELSDDGDCSGAEEAVAEVTAEVEELRDVDPKLKAALREGSTRLSVAVGRCEEETTTEETEPTLDTDVEDEEVEEDEKPKKEKPDEDEEPPEPTEEPTEPDEGQELPPASNGEEKGGGGESPPPVQPEPEVAPPAGGVSPSRGVE